MELVFVRGEDDEGQASFCVFLFKQCLSGFLVERWVAKLCKLLRAVGLRAPVLISHDLFRSVSMIFVWHERDHTGAQYSAPELHKAIAVCFIVCWSVPHFEFPSIYRKKLLLSFWSCSCVLWRIRFSSVLCEDKRGKGYIASRCHSNWYSVCG